jgi:hypothetical protein
VKAGEIDARRDDLAFVRAGAAQAARRAGDVTAAAVSSDHDVGKISGLLARLQRKLVT